MSRITSDDQLNFLLKCVKHTNNGKPDFSAVAEECGIVTKGAAAKRYERLMKANGINPNGGPASPTAESPEKPATTPKKAQKSPAKPKSGDNGGSGSAKKRGPGKAATTGSPSKKTKSEEKVVEAGLENGDEGVQMVVKKEDGLRGDNDPFLPQVSDVNGEHAMFHDFCDTAAAGARADENPAGINPEDETF